MKFKFLEFLVLKLIMKQLVKAYWIKPWIQSRDKKF